MAQAPATTAAATQVPLTVAISLLGATAIAFTPPAAIST